MIDPVTMAAIDLALHAISAGAHIVTASKVNNIQKTLKIQRVEITCCEAGVAVTGLIQALDHFLWKKEMKKFREDIDNIDTDFRTRVDNLSMRIDNLSTTIADKPPIVTVVPTQQSIDSEKETDTEKDK